MKVNAYLGILLAIGLMLGETIRSWGQNRNILLIIDDFIFGGILLIGSILTLRKHKLGLPILIAGWASCFGMTYGSFFSKIIAIKENFNSNINQDFLLVLIGLAFVGSTIGLIWAINIFKNRI